MPTDSAALKRLLRKIEREVLSPAHLRTWLSACGTTVAGFHWPLRTTSTPSPHARLTRLIGEVFMVGAAIGFVSCTSSTSPSSATTTYTGPFSGQLIQTVISGIGGIAPPRTCLDNVSLNGTLKLRLQPPQADGTVMGTGELTGTEVQGSPSCSDSIEVGRTTNIAIAGIPVTGTTGSLVFVYDPGGVGDGAGHVVGTRITFSGALSAGVISGSLPWVRTGGGPGVTRNGTTTLSVTLR